MDQSAFLDATSILNNNLIASGTVKPLLTAIRPLAQLKSLQLL